MGWGVLSDKVFNFVWVLNSKWLMKSPVQPGKEITSLITKCSENTHICSVPYLHRGQVPAHICCSSTLQGQKPESTYQLETWFQGMVGGRYGVVGENFWEDPQKKFYKQILENLSRNSSNMKVLTVLLQ